MLLSICSEPKVLEIMRIINILITIVQVIVPITLIIVLMLKFAKAVTGNNDDLLSNVKKSAPVNVIAAVLIFLVPTFVRIVTGIAFPDSDYENCLKVRTIKEINAIYQNKMDDLIKTAEETLSVNDYINAKNYLVNIKDSDKKKEYNDKLEAINIQMNEVYEKNIVKLINVAKETLDKEDYKKAKNYLVNIKNENKKAKYSKELDEIIITITKAENNYSITPGGIVPGEKYNISEEDLIYLANVCFCEQGSVDGVKAEMSLAANLYELKKDRYSSVVDYVKRSGWFSCATTKKVAKQEHIEAVRDVIVNGNRTLPPYINEHDCFDCNKSLCKNGNRGDICKLVIDGVSYESLDFIKNRNNYISGKTIIYNKYGGVYTFYIFPCERCDPFGYTDSAYKKYNP